MEFENIFRPPGPDVTLLDWSGISVHYSGYNDPVVRAIQGGAVDKINVHKRIDKIKSCTI